MFASWLVMAKVSLYVVKDLLGQSSTRSRSAMRT
ncbi:hypothetical protein [Burkholderia thailandensis]